MLKDVWRYVVLQLLDDYTSTLTHHGVGAVAAVGREEPQPTGDARIDAALVALAEHLARRDGWPVPAWALNPACEAWPW